MLTSQDRRRRWLALRKQATVVPFPATPAPMPILAPPVPRPLSPLEAINPPDTDESNDPESARGRLQLLVQRISGLAWVFTGDSLRGPSDGNREWRTSAERLLEHLQGRMYRTSDVVIDSTGFGSMLSSLRQELDERALRYRPDIVLICLGTNEARAGMKGIELFEHQLAVVVEEILAAGAVPVLCTPPAVKAGATVDQLVYVEAIRAAAAEFDVPLVDHWDYWERMSTQVDLDRWCDDSTGLPGRHGHIELVQKLISDLELRRDRRSAKTRT